MSGTLNSARLAARSLPVPVRSGRLRHRQLRRQLLRVGRRPRRWRRVRRSTQAVRVVESLSPYIGSGLHAWQTDHRTGDRSSCTRVRPASHSCMTLHAGQMEVLAHVKTSRMRSSDGGDGVGLGPSTQRRRRPRPTSLANRSPCPRRRRRRAARTSSKSCATASGRASVSTAGLGTVGCFMFPAA